MDVNFEYYKIFYYVAKYGNITKAAAALDSNQPNVSRIIKLLETQLNCRLIIREPRGIRLTETGEQLYSHVEVAYRHLLEAQEEICGHPSSKEGTVEIGATETALHLFLFDILHGFKTEYPAIKIKIHNHTTHETIKQLLNGKLDFALITTPFAAPKTLRSEKMLDFHEILVGGTEYSSLCHTAMKLKDMKNYPWIGLERGTVTYELYSDFFLRHNTELSLDMEVASSGLMLPLIANNLGIGFVPGQLAQPLLQKGTLVQVQIDCEIPKRQIQLASDRGRGKSFAADTFYHYLKNVNLPQNIQTSANYP